MVYIITSGEYSDYGVRAVTLNKDKAELLKKMYMAKGYNYVEIEEWEEDDTGDVFTPKEEMTEPVEYYQVRISRTDSCGIRISRTDSCGSFVITKYRFEHKPPQGEFKWAWNKEDHIDTDVYYVDVEAKDKEHAMKIAQDMYAKARAEYYGI